MSVVIKLSPSMCPSHFHRFSKIEREKLYQTHAKSDENCCKCVGFKLLLKLKFLEFLSSTFVSWFSLYYSTGQLRQFSNAITILSVTLLSHFKAIIRLDNMNSCKSSSSRSIGGPYTAHTVTVSALKHDMKISDDKVVPAGCYYLLEVEKVVIQLG